MTHALKTWPEFYGSIVDGSKPFELRKNDRNFQLGDRLLIQEYDPVTKQYTGKECEKRIGYILRGAERFGLKKDYVILGLETIEF